MSNQFKAGDVFILTRDGIVQTMVIKERMSLGRAEIAYIYEGKGGHIDTGAGVTRLTDLIRPNIVRTDWTAWAEAVGRLTDYLLALPAEAME